MQGMFSMDSKLMQGLNRAADLLGLNLLFLLTCLPVVTVGASATALYTVCFRMGTDREDGVVKPYFRAFRENFRQATPVWLILALVMGMLGFDFLAFLGRPGWMSYLPVVFFFMLAYGAMVISTVFPLMSQFGNSLRGTLRNAMLLALGCAPRVLLLTLINVLPGLVFLIYPYLFLRVGFLWLSFYSAVSAYLGSRLLGSVMERLKGEPEAA